MGRQQTGEEEEEDRTCLKDKEVTRQVDLHSVCLWCCCWHHRYQQPEGSPSLSAAAVSCTSSLLPDGPVSAAFCLTGLGFVPHQQEPRRWSSFQLWKVALSELPAEEESLPPSIQMRDNESSDSSFGPQLWAETVKKESAVKVGHESASLLLYNQRGVSLFLGHHCLSESSVEEVWKKEEPLCFISTPHFDMWELEITES